jgi:hypothetical protein
VYGNELDAGGVTPPPGWRSCTAGITGVATCHGCRAESGQNRPMPWPAELRHEACSLGSSKAMTAIISHESAWRTRISDPGDWSDAVESYRKPSLLRRVLLWMFVISVVAASAAFTVYAVAHRTDRTGDLARWALGAVGAPLPPITR